MTACPECGKNEWDSGQIKLSWVGRLAIYQKQYVYFQSYNKKFKGKRPLAAVRCLNCNHIKLNASTQIDRYF